MKEIDKIITSKIEDLLNERFEAIERNFNKEVFLTEDEASMELKISSKTLANMRRSGKLTKECYLRVGRSVRYKKNRLIENFCNLNQ
tara:strand:+ start:424 stop:684 length:261 start_codon:yes stop_codon:yes gene_type:complete